MTVIGINGSPRSTWNTAQLVKKALEGAASNGFATEMINLNEINFKPCNSCLICKKSPKHEGTCYQKDDLLPILEKIKNAKAVVFGSPIYVHTISALFHSFSERLLFSNTTYRDYSYVLNKKIKSGMIFNMGSTSQEAKEYGYDKVYEKVQAEFVALFGSCETLKVFDTMEVNDYSKYEMQVNDQAHKVQIKRDVFPEDLRKAYELGKKITSE